MPSSAGTTGTPARSASPRPSRPRARGSSRPPSHARAIGADAPGSSSDAVSRGVVSPTRATSNPFGGPGGDDDDDDDFFEPRIPDRARARDATLRRGPAAERELPAATTDPASIATSATTAPAPAHHAAAPTRLDEVPRNINISSSSPSARPLTSRSILSSI